MGTVTTWIREMTAMMPFEAFAQHNEFFYSKNYKRPEAQQADYERLQRMIQEYDNITGPRVGDFIKMSNGEFHRFSADWDTGFQTSRCGSWYIGKDFENGVFVDFSGALDPIIPHERIKPTDGIQLGWVWTFHNSECRAGYGINCLLPFRVFEIIPE